MNLNDSRLMQHPGIPRQPFCSLLSCGRTGTIVMHHIIPRSRGGHEGPQVPLCSGCHAAHHDGRHRLAFDYAERWYGGHVGQHLTPLVIADPEEAA